MGIYIEGFEKMLDRLEQVKERIVTAIQPLGRLMHSDVRRIRTEELKKGTYGK